MKRAILAGAAVTLWIVAGTSFAATKGEVSLQDRRQAACYDDVQKLCPNTIPDVAKTTTCMQDKKSMVSQKCAALWDVKE